MAIEQRCRSARQWLIAVAQEREELLGFLLHKISAATYYAFPRARTNTNISLTLKLI
jgi:hypothetical protein